MDPAGFLAVDGERDGVADVDADPVVRGDLEDVAGDDVGRAGGFLRDGEEHIAALREAAQFAGEGQGRPDDGLGAAGVVVHDAQLMALPPLRPGTRLVTTRVSGTVPVSVAPAALVATG